MTETQWLNVAHDADVGAAKRLARSEASAAGFDADRTEEIVLAVSELASNLLRHAGVGTLMFRNLQSGDRSGIEFESSDGGPGIGDVEQAVTDGFSTAGGLGCGLGTVHRLCDECEIVSEFGRGTRVFCRCWLPAATDAPQRCPLSIGIATRLHPNAMENGDSFIIKHCAGRTLTGVIDGLGHGKHAHLAAQAARHFVEKHAEQPLADLFLGVERECRKTRGVVMTLARIHWQAGKLAFAAIGNVEAKLSGSEAPPGFVMRRGILGAGAPKPVVSEHPWHDRNILVLYSDGIRSHWQWEDFPELAHEPAGVAAQKLLAALARGDDDATVLVVNGNRR